MKTKGFSFSKIRVPNCFQLSYQSIEFYIYLTIKQTNKQIYIVVLSVYIVGQNS